ncbi:MAG: LamG domain-containing protein, partial [Candidatus Tritonobacter lacicola]|nr:LamG domain-containing protein [Candidatus Tritonobacter lacicola]
GKIGRAGSFDGSNDYIDCGNDPSLNITGPITVEAWARLDSFSDRTIVAKCNTLTGGGPFTTGYVLRTDIPTNTFLFGIGDGTTGTFVPSSAKSAGIFYHVAGTYDGQELKIYINGVLENTVNVATTIANAAVPLTIGRAPAAGGGYCYFDGLLDEVAIHRKALTEEEIINHYQQGADPTPTPTPTAEPISPTPTSTPTQTPTMTPTTTPTPTSTPPQTPTPTVTPTSTPTATPTPTNPPTSFGVKINFQPNWSVVPEGYTMDDGSPYGPKEDTIEFGWREEG